MKATTPSTPTPNWMPSSLLTEPYDPSLLARFNQLTQQEIPILQAMGISFSEYDRGQLRVEMPLQPNINDKNTGFGGSIVTLATITGWGLLSLLLNSREKRYEVIIAESNTRYLAPVTGDCYARTRLGDTQTEKLLLDLERVGKSLINIDVEVCLEDQIVASFRGHYYARRKPAS